MPKLPNWIILSKIFIFLVILVMIFFCLNIWKYFLSNLNLVISTYYLAIEWWLGCGVFTFWLDGGAIILNQRLETNTETAKLNNPVKNLYFFKIYWLWFFSVKTTERLHCQTWIWSFQPTILAIEWWLGCGVSTFWLDGGVIILNQTTRNQCRNCQNE